MKEQYYVMRKKILDDFSNNKGKGSWKNLKIFFQTFSEAHSDAEMLLLRKNARKRARRKTVVASIVCLSVILALVGIGIYLDVAGIFYGAKDVVFFADGQEYVEIDAVKYNHYVTLNVPQKMGYDVVEIVDDVSGQIVFDSEGQSFEPISDRSLSDYDAMCLRVCYKPHIYTANIATSGGEAVSASIEFTVEDSPEILPEPQRLEGYVFDGYYIDSAFKQPFSGNFLDYAADTPLLLYPRYFLDGWEITWDLCGGEWLSEIGLNDYTILTDMPLPDRSEVSRTGYELAGWTVNGKPVDYFSPTVMDDVIISAIWAPVAYSIDYQTDGGVFESTPIKTYTIEDVVELPIPSKRGYLFKGWFNDQGEEVSVIKEQYGNITVRAEYIPIEYTVSYDCNGGKNNALNPTSYTADDGIVRLKPASRQGYTFGGWYLNGKNEAVETISALRYGNVSLKALWTPKTYTITVNPANGDSAYFKHVKYGDFYVINMPQRRGYTFDRFVVGDEEFVIADVYSMTADISITAEYTVNTYTLTCVSENKITEQFEVEYGSAYRLVKPLRIGYEFIEWQTKESYSVPEIGVYDFDKDIVLYAVWIKVLTVNLMPHTEYRIDSGIDKAYIYGNYDGTNEPMKNISIYISERARDLTLILINVGIKAPNDKTAIECQNFSYRMTVITNGAGYIEGGNGSPGKNGVDGGMTVANKDGQKGGDGKPALECGRVIFEGGESGSHLTLKSGSGGAGGRGGVDYDRSRMWLNFLANGARGGDSLSSMICSDYAIVNTKVSFVQDDAGSGGSAGKRGTWFGYFYGTKGQDGRTYPPITIR